MGCWKEYTVVSGAGLVGSGSVAVTVVSAGVLLAAGIATAIGSLLLLIAALKDLADCLDKKGKNQEAARLRRKVADLELDVERLKRLLPDSYRRRDT